MDFLNQQVDVGTIPHAENVEWKKVEHHYLSVLRIQWMIFSLILFAIIAFFIFLLPVLRQASWIILLSGAGVLLSGLYLFLIHKSFHTRAYALRDHDVLYRHGWLMQVSEVCPFNRIQHCSVNSGPIERKYGLASITIFTAASGEADLRIPGLKEETAFAIREFIMKKISPHEGAAV